MVRHSRSLAAAALVASVVVGGVVVSAQRPGFGPGQRRAQAGLALRGLDLTEAQREQVRQLTEQSREQTRHAARPFADGTGGAAEGRGGHSVQ